MNRIRKAAVTAFAGATLLAGTAVPASASASCHEDPLLNCLCRAVAGALSPVIPPESWDCNF